MYVNRAIQMMNSGSPSRCGLGGVAEEFVIGMLKMLSMHGGRSVVDLERALEENSAVRCPVLSAAYDREDVCLLPPHWKPHAWGQSGQSNSLLLSVCR